MMLGPEPLSARDMEPQAIEELIRAGLPGAAVRVQSDDNTHFAALVISEAFAGKRSIARHQLVYGALGPLVGREIHALSIEALTPEEAQARGLQATGDGPRARS